MDIENARKAASAIAESITQDMEAVRKFNPDLDRIYGACLAVLDDFSDLNLFLNTESHLAEQSADEKWDVYSWWSEGIEIDTSPIQDLIGEVDDFDAEPENDLGPAWLAVLTLAMAEAKKKGAFNTTGDPPYVFCTITDSEEALWIEHLSGQFLNDAEVFTKLSAEILECYGTDEDPLSSGRMEYRVAYENALAELTKDA